MTPDTKQPNRAGAAIFNLPNQLTSLRLVLSVVLFCLMETDYYLASFVLFVIGAGTDWIDGYFARKYGQVTTLGRILDPFADKVIVCGTYIFLAANPVMNHVFMGLRAWIVVVIVGRELLVTALRSFIEERGGDFSAQWSGKIKMVLQCFAAGVCLFYLYLTQEHPLENGPQWCRVLLIGSVWSAVISTVYSGAVYVRAAIKMFQNQCGDREL
jgi:CDP-diacylglycerol--glycerol-3-phosphate 3-phosphatidyltransferase